jgi:outer membrane protein TolC
MIIRLLLIGLLTVSGSGQAVQSVNPPGLLPADIAVALLQQDPGVAAARANLDVALQEAGILDRSPYEWTTTVMGQRRVQNYGPNNSSNGNREEWHVGVERTFRLPGKAMADRNIGKAAVDESHAHYGEARHEAARELMTLWVDWLAAERARELAENSLQLTQVSLAAVQKRVRAGDASKLDLSIARAELAEQRRSENDAKTQAVAAWSGLSTRFPGMKRQVIALPMPLPLGEDVAFWRDRILAQSDEFKVVQTQMQKTQAYAERARAEKVPDPKVGIYQASEIDGRERISGVMLSVPIPGSVRDLRSAKANAAMEVSLQEVELKKRQLESKIVSAIVIARGAYVSLQIANEGAAAMQENSRLMQRAYALGEAELQAMLLARRQASAAMTNALQAQVTALAAYYRLLVDAHLIWGLEHG